jgi:uncharacterized protein YjiS (DUF1127 family)
MSSLTPCLSSRYDADTPAPVADGIGRRLRELAFTVIEELIAWRERATERVQLAALDERQLHDIGLARADLEPEISKPFWRP